MSPYASELAFARLDALRTLIDALNEAESPEEKRRCAVAIFNAPDPCELDDEIELEDEDENDDDPDQEANEAETDSSNEPDDDAAAESDKHSDATHVAQHVESHAPTRCDPAHETLTAPP